MYPDRRPVEPIRVPKYERPKFEPVPKYVPKKGGLVTQALGAVRPVSKQRPDPQLRRAQNAGIAEDNYQPPKKRKTKAQLAAFNTTRRKKRNSPGFSFDADCVQKPSGGSGAAARWNPTPKQKRDQQSRAKKQPHARRWC